MEAPEAKSPKSRWLKLLIMGGSLIVVVCVSLWESSERTSPGPLHESHRQTALLEGSSNCAQCHGGTFRSMGKSCLSCHEEISSQLTAEEGIHGSLTNSAAMQCADCHVEHTDGTIPLVAESSFAAVGVARETDYDHEHVEWFALVDRHEEVGCESCHPNARATHLERDTFRYLSLEQDCASCHEDVHETSFGSDCASCHGQAHAFEEAPLFNHDASFALAGAHGEADCVACHKADTEHEVAALIGNPFTTRACADCHESPHREAFLDILATDWNQLVDASCKQCHDPHDATFRGSDARMTADYHAATGFELTAPHNEASCKECHEEQSGVDALSTEIRFASLYPGRSAQDCATCHGDPHRGEFDSGFSRGECTACHEKSHFSPSRFDTTFHERTNFSLTGAHQSADCAKCHTESHEPSLQFLPLTSSCSSCHDDAHGGGFDSVFARQDPGAETDCAKCHTTESFSNVGWTAKEHAEWTEFPLTGSHARIDCIACHLPTRKKSPEGRTFGIAQKDCASCHADPHANQFAVQGKVDCAQCHGTATAWSDSRFDHQSNSRFALDEHHGKLDCAACHRQSTLTNGRTAIRYKPLGVQCADCHGFEFGSRGASP